MQHNNPTVEDVYLPCCYTACASIQGAVPIARAPASLRLPDLGEELCVQRLDGPLPLTALHDHGHVGLGRALAHHLNVDALAVQDGEGLGGRGQGQGQRQG